MTTLVGHNLISDLSMLIRAGHALPEHVQYFDTYVAARWVWPDMDDYGLESLALRCTNIGQWRDTIGKLDQAYFDAMPDDRLFQRCGGDAQAPVLLQPLLATEINDLGMGAIWTLAMSVLPILAEMGGRGMALDSALLSMWASETHLWLQHAEHSLKERLKIDNINSNTQVANALYKPPWDASPLYKNQTGYSVDRLSLLWARKQALEKKQNALVQLLTDLIEYGVKEKLQSTYYTPWREQHDHACVYSEYSLGVTSTGRLSSRRTNLQNVPPSVREAIIPSPGYDVIIQSDYNMLELCVAAHLSNDPLMLKWIQEGLDIHSIMAARVLGLKEPTTQKEGKEFKARYPVERATGKLTNFATIFGILANSLSWKIFQDTDGSTWIPEADMQRYIDTFFTTFSGYNKYSQRGYRELAEGKTTVSPFHRRWNLPATHAGHRKWLNYPTQSTASDLTILALNKIDHTLKTNNMKSRLIGEVHDAIILESTIQEQTEVLRIVKHICEHPNTQAFGFTLNVPLRVELKVGPTWGTLTEVIMT